MRVVSALLVVAACAPLPRIRAPRAADPEPVLQESRAMPSSNRENRLARETSPYLLQHAHNPVDWYPWGSEAFARARSEDKPIFLSVGYSACHWCHVMEHECFEDEAIAALMNASFVCVKVDREERPDVDEIYMKAVQLLTRSGGWPMSVWLTPEGKPFFGGTYFPPQDRQGRPGFPRVCSEMARLWKEERARVTAAADGLTDEVRRIAAPAPSEGVETLPGGLTQRAAELIVRGFDEEHGGFGGAPKFPHPMDLSLLLRVDARFGHPVGRHAALHTLQKMAAGGIYDQVGGGFHRYSTDEQWLVPHFEKMLYDNAQLANVYLDAWLATGDPDHLRIVREVLDYVLREMTAPAGGFWSTQDADSEGEEGKFFVWDRAELAAAVGEETAAWLAPFYGVAEGGNFEHGKSVLSRPQTVAEFAKARQKPEPEITTGLGVARCKLFGERAKRVAPARDEKILADWNGLMLSAFARAGFHLKEARYTAAARKAADFVRARLWSEEGGGRLLRSFKSGPDGQDGQAKHSGNLADYAFLAEGFLDLYGATFEPADLAFARRLVDVTLERFWDEPSGGFWYTASDQEALIARSKDAYDGATPSGTSVQALNLLRLAELTGAESYREKARRLLAAHRTTLERQPQALARMLWAVDFLESRPREIVLAGDSAAAVEPLLEVLRKGFDPNRVVLLLTPTTSAALAELSAQVEGKGAVGGKAAAWICRDGTCKLPITDPAALARELAARD